MLRKPALVWTLVGAAAAILVVQGDADAAKKKKRTAALAAAPLQAAVSPCPAGTVQFDPNFNICVLAPPATACPAGTAAAFPGAEFCILDPLSIPKYTQNLVIPPEMPSSGTKNGVKYYEIAVRQFQQQILPAPMPSTTVWSYGRASDPLPAVAPNPAVSSFNYPAFTVEAVTNTPTRVKWINGLTDAAGTPLKHLLPVDQTIHWANPAQDCRMGPPRTDCEGKNPAPYLGPVPIVTHLHGAHVGPESDGYPEAWWLPGGTIPAGYAKKGSNYDQFDRTNTTPGSAVFQYPNTQPPATLWYHDHSLGMTRSNVYAGPAGFWLLRGGPEPAGLPGPSPRIGDAGGPYYEVPIVIQDRSFNPDGSLFYPPSRAFFEGVTQSQLNIPFVPSLALNGLMSDVAPIWNPEAFFNTMVVNGSTWPAFHVEPRRYRLRLLNGCDSRFLNLSLQDVTGGVPGAQVPLYQIGAEGGYLPNAVRITVGESTVMPGGGVVPPATPASDPARALLLALAERADVIVDFTGMAGKTIQMNNTGPDAPFGGFPAIPLADPATTGQVMQFIVDQPLNGTDTTVAPASLVLTPGPAVGALTNPTPRKVSVNEIDSMTPVCVLADAVTGAFIVPINEVSCTMVPPAGQIVVPFGPVMSLLGTVDAAGNQVILRWSDAITETPKLGDVEEWDIYNFTVDAHPIHLHLVQFEVINRENLVLGPGGVPVQPVVLTGTLFPAEPTEAGLKDTVIVYPGTVTRVKAHFDIAGLYVWHCHILEHEDNEMMRSYVVKATPDMNGDGVLNSADLLLLNAKLRLRLPDESALAYDLNGDGKFDLLDARFLTTQPGYTP